jgi:hypothetical protein
MLNKISKVPATNTDRDQLRFDRFSVSSPAHANGSPLAELVGNYLQSKGLRQVDFCRQTGFDQGLLSKILSSVVTTLNIESALKLAEGMGLPPAVVFEAIGKSEVDEMLRRLYSNCDKPTAKPV